MLQIFCVSAKKKTIFATCNQQKQHKDRENKRECNAKRSKEINCDASTMMVFNENYTSLNYSRAKDVNAIRSVGWLGCVCARIFFPYFLFVFGGWLAFILFSNFLYLFASFCRAATHAACIHGGELQFTQNQLRRLLLLLFQQIYAQHCVWCAVFDLIVSFFL